MKTTGANSAILPVPSMFQIAAFFEDFFPGVGRPRFAGAAADLPVAKFMVNPEALINLLTGRNQVGAATMVTGRDERRSSRPARTGPAKRPPIAPQPSAKGAASNGAPAGVPSPRKLKKVQFTFTAPAAHTVKLAGDFTDWDQRAIAMQMLDGVWFAVVPLPPGLYAYRFIVDGCWADDPKAQQRAANPFGSENSLIRVI